MVGRSSSSQGLAADASTLSMSVVEHLWDQYQISEDFWLFVPSSDGRVISPPSSYIAFYLENLSSSLRFSVAKFLRNIFNYY